MTIDPYQLAEEIKNQIDTLVDRHGTDALAPLDAVATMPSWIMLKNEGNRIILLAMKMYLEGVIRTLHREKIK